MRAYVPIALAFALISQAAETVTTSHRSRATDEADVPLVPAPPCRMLRPTPTRSRTGAGQANDHSNPAFKGGGLQSRRNSKRASGQPAIGLRS